MVPFTNQAPVPSAFGEWQSSHMNLPNTFSPCAISSALAVCTGGFGTGGTTSGGVGNGVAAPILKANNREGPRFDCGVAMALTGPNNREAEPRPTGISTYWSPCTVKLTGTESMAEPVLTDHSFCPLSAENAANSPAPSPWNTRLPAVDSTPPLVGNRRITDQRADCCTGSHATKRPTAWFK